MTHPTDDRAAHRPTPVEQYIIDVRAHRIGNIIAYMGTIIARGLVLEQEAQYEAPQE